MTHETENAGHARVPERVFHDVQDTPRPDDLSRRVSETHRHTPLERITFSLVADMASVEREWRMLEASPSSSLHQAYDWCRAWADAHRSHLLIIRAEAEGECLMLLPLEIIHRHGMRTASYLGQSHNNVNTGLFSESFPALGSSEIEILQKRLRETLQGQADLLLLETTPRIWRGMANPLANLTAIENPNHTFQLQLHRSFEATLAQVNAKRRRKKFRVQTRRFEEAGGYDHICPATVEGQRDLLETFFRQKGQRLRVQGLPDVFGVEETRDFFRRLLLAENGPDHYPLRLHAIRMKGEHDGKIAAIAGLSRKGDHVICQFGSIDETLAPETSPGELLFWLMIEQACRDGAALFDFGRGDQPYKRSWCNIETTTYDLMLALSRRGVLAMQAHRILAKAKGAVKRSPTVYRFVQRLRARGGTPAATVETAD